LSWIAVSWLLEDCRDEHTAWRTANAAIAVCSMALRIWKRKEILPLDHLGNFPGVDVLFNMALTF
jgi:hypothetical protein